MEARCGKRHGCSSACGRGGVVPWGALRCAWWSGPVFVINGCVCSRLSRWLSRGGRIQFFRTQVVVCSRLSRWLSRRGWVRFSEHRWWCAPVVAWVWRWRCCSLECVACRLARSLSGWARDEAPPPPPRPLCGFRPLFEGSRVWGPRVLSCVRCVSCLLGMRPACSSVVAPRHQNTRWVCVLCSRFFVACLPSPCARYAFFALFAVTILCYVRLNI
jgi:hypothetical protein